MTSWLIPPPFSNSAPACCAPCGLDALGYLQLRVGMRRAPRAGAPDHPIGLGLVRIRVPNADVVSEPD